MSLTQRHSGSAAGTGLQICSLHAAGCHREISPRLYLSSVITHITDLIITRIIASNRQNISWDPSKQRSQVKEFPFIMTLFCSLSVSICPDLLLVESDHMTKILASHWSSNVWVSVCPVPVTSCNVCLAQGVITVPSSQLTPEVRDGTWPPLPLNTE